MDTNEQNQQDKRETEQPNREGWERSTKESIEREV